jgi:hypothetical protein
MSQSIVPIRPDSTRFRKAAPFKRNDVMLEQLPAGVLQFPGISANLADKARKMGIPVWAVRVRWPRLLLKTISSLPLSFSAS